jgi:hypothetical protein
VWPHAFSAACLLHGHPLQVLHLSATVSPSQDAAFMLGIGWTTFNLVMSGFFIAYKVRRPAPPGAGSYRLLLTPASLHDACCACW